MAVDEVHTFDLDEIVVIGRLLQRGTPVVAAGIDLDNLGGSEAPPRRWRLHLRGPLPLALRPASGALAS